jgi:hypothetical protein
LPSFSSSREKIINELKPAYHGSGGETCCDRAGERRADRPIALRSQSQRMSATGESKRGAGSGPRPVTDWP